MDQLLQVFAPYRFARRTLTGGGSSAALHHH
jgi:hypothetical protein